MLSRVIPAIIPSHFSSLTSLISSAPIMNYYDAAAQSYPPPPPRPPTKSARPFVSADNRPAQHDHKFRVIIISTGSVASVRVPNIVAGLSKDPNIQVQVVATKSSLHFYNQGTVDNFVREAFGLPQVSGSEANAGPSSNPDIGVRIWEDADEWSDWRNLGDPILHIELRRWADLVVVAPCSADMLARIAGGLCDTLALSLLRALPSTTPVMLYPAMNTHMYSHPYTAKHLRSVQDDLGYLVYGPQGVGRLACGDDGPGKMTDWRDICINIQNFASMFQQQKAVEAATAAMSLSTSQTSSSTSPSNSGDNSYASGSNSDSKLNSKTHAVPLEDPMMGGRRLWQQPGLPSLAGPQASQPSMGLGPVMPPPPLGMRTIQEMGGQTANWPMVWRMPVAGASAPPEPVQRKEDIINVIRVDVDVDNGGGTGAKADEEGRRSPPTPGGSSKGAAPHAHWRQMAEDGTMWDKKFWVG